MGAVIQPDQKIQASMQFTSTANFTDDKKVAKDYNTEVIEVSNIALAIRNKEQTINVELALRCENLPSFKAFGSTDSMIVVLKSDDLAKAGLRNYVEIGRTQVVSNEINPKYIKTFIFPFKGQTTEQLQFRVYHMLNPKSDDLRQQKLIGKVNINLYNLVDSEKEQQQIKQLSKTNSKAILKMNCSQYEGGNSYYEVGIDMNNFTSLARTELHYIIEAWKYGDWVPVVKSESRRPPGKFRQIKVPYNKFQGQDNSGVRIKMYDSLKQEEVGSTKQFSITDITSQQKSQTHRVFHSGFVIGVIAIRWKKFTRDSFISYIVGGSRLHLLLAVDFTNSNNQNGQSLHKLDDNGQNVYINAIREIVGVLQYFSVQNQVALYGFGAKLPPFYKSVSQCFALNGNYFHPNVEGGVEEIIRLYKQNLQKIKLYGPTRFSQILELAIKYASEEEAMSTKTSTYYVLLIITDGRINDYQDTVDLIIKAASLPLSVMFVGVGNGDQENEKNTFQLLHKLDEQTFQLRSSKTGKVCERDIVDLIKMSDFAKDDTKQTLARQAFDQIPNHFIDYMSSKNIKPLKDKKTLKAAKSQFIAEKIKSNPQKIQPFMSSFLEKEKKEMKKKLINLGFNMNDPMIQKMSIAMNDLSYFIEVHSQNKKVKTQQIIQRVEFINTREVKKLEEYLDKKDEDKKIRILEKLQKIEGNHYGKRLKAIKKHETVVEVPAPILAHPCLSCKSQEINMIHLECGHCSVCKKCFTTRCPICYHINNNYKEIKYNEKGEIYESEQQSSDD